MVSSFFGKKGMPLNNFFSVNQREKMKFPRRNIHQKMSGRFPFFLIEADSFQ